MPAAGGVLQQTPVSGPAGAGAGGGSGHGARELQVGAGRATGDSGGEAPECGRGAVQVPLEN